MLVDPLIEHVTSLPITKESQTKQNQKFSLWSTRHVCLSSRVNTTRSNTSNKCSLRQTTINLRHAESHLQLTSSQTLWHPVPMLLRLYLRMHVHSRACGVEMVGERLEHVTCSVLGSVCYCSCLSSVNNYWCSLHVTSIHVLGRCHLLSFSPSCCCTAGRLQHSCGSYTVLLFSLSVSPVPDARFGSFV